MAELNSDLLRTFLAVAETGSVTEGAQRIFRSQSAASLQIKKLEDVVGQPVFDRHGRGVVLTDIGERLLPVAREITRNLEATLRDLTSDGLDGKLRLGLPDDQSQEVLARIIGAFSQSHPGVELDVSCTLSAGFPDALAAGALDLAVYEAPHPPSGVDVLRQERTCWVMSRHHDLLARDPIPVALFDRECWWRDVALQTLHATGRPFRVTYSSQSVAGVSAAIKAGIAVGVLGETSVTDDMHRLGPDDGFGETPISNLVLGTGPDANSPAIAAMKDAICQAFGGGPSQAR